LDLILQKVFTRMRKRSTARSGGASTSLAGVGSWTSGRGSKAVARSLRRMRERESDRSGSDSNGRKTKGNEVNPASGRPIYRGSTESIRCGSFHCTICLNGSIPRSSREDQGGFFANRLQLRPKSEFRSLAKKTTSCRPDGKSFCKTPHHVNLGL
jgi:hypothetical protein